MNRHRSVCAFDVRMLQNKNVVRQCPYTMYDNYVNFKAHIIMVVMLNSEQNCFTLIVRLVSYDCYCSVALPRGALGWSAVCDCDTF